MRRETARATGVDVAFATTPEAAVATLSAPEGCFTHLLVDPDFAGASLPVLAALTAGEPSSGVAMVLLAPPQSSAGAPVARTRTIDHRIEGWLVAALAPLDEPILAAPSEAELHAALREGRVSARYQPIVRMSDREPVGLEILARLEHPARGTLPPDLFVPGMERAGLGWPFTQAILRRAFEAWDGGRLAATGLVLAVNVPLDVLKVPSALEWIEAARAPTGIVATDMLIELTESQPIGETANLGVAVRLFRELGYGIAIDDVGPDVRDHSALLGLPFTALKLDKDLVHNALTDGSASSFLVQAIAASRRAGLRVVAEGVENLAMWEAMRALGVDEAQGFLVSRPLPAEAVSHWLAHWRARLAAAYRQVPSAPVK